MQPFFLLVESAGDLFVSLHLNAHSHTQSMLASQLGGFDFDLALASQTRFHSPEFLPRLIQDHIRYYSTFYGILLHGFDHRLDENHARLFA